jgi:multidrug efflux system membrane fusion protein
MPSTRRLLIGVAVLALAAGVASVAIRSTSGSHATGPKAAQPAVPVTVAPVVVRTVPVRLRAVGNVEPYKTVAIKARVDGQIVGVRFKEGDEVHQGDTLFEIDRRPFEAQLAQAQANALKDQALLDHARDQEKRYKDLLERKFISADAFAQVHTNTETAAATLRADEAAIGGIRLQLDYCTIRAPITGYAGKIMIQQGNLVKANDTNALVVVNQVVPVYASFSIPEQNLADVRRYQADGELRVEAGVASSRHAPVAGTLSFIDNSTDVATGTIKLKAEFANADKALWPGQFVDVVLTLTQQRNATVVPSTSIQNGPNGQYVFIVKPDQTVDLRDVKVARSEGDDTIIASGLTPGEKVVTVGQLRLAPGMRIAAESKAANL